MIRLDADPPLHLIHRNTRGDLKHLRKAAFVLGRQMEHDDEGDAAVRRYVLEKPLDRLNTARGGADPDNQEISAVHPSCFLDHDA